MRVCRVAIAISLGLVSMAWAGGAGSPKTEQRKGPEVQSKYAGKIPAPEFPAGLQWLNTQRAVTMKELRGKIVLLDFWTYC